MPNLPVDVDSWGRSACYPQGSFYPLSDGISTHIYLSLIHIFMNFQYGVGKRLILPWFALTLKVIVKRLSADLQRVAIKTDFSDVSAVKMCIRDRLDIITEM